MMLSTVRSRQGFLSMPAMGLVIGLGTAAAFYGCVPAISVEEEKAPRAAEVRPAQPQERPPERAAAPVQETALEAQAFKLQELSVTEENGQTTLRIKFSQPVTQYRHFTLTTPSRIVLDANGDAKRLARVENFRFDTHWLSGLRLSSSDGYLRLVIELTAATVPAYVADPEEGGLKVVIGPVNPQFTAKKDLQLVRGGKRTDVAGTEGAPGSREGSRGQAAAPTAEKSYTGQRISLDFKDADIKNVFRLLAELSGLNLVVTDDVRKRVTIRLIDVPWDQALDLIVDTNGLGREQVGNVLRISTAGQIKAEKDALLAAKKAEENLEPLQTAYLSVNYARVKELLDKIKPALSTRGVIVADDRSNTILVRDIKKGIDEANAIASRLDIRTPQVLIESNLIETTPSFSRALGMRLQLGTPGDNNIVVASQFPAGDPAGVIPFIQLAQRRLGAFRDLNAELSAAEQEGNIKIISRPSVVTLNNVASTIQSLRIIRVTLPAGTSSTAVGAGAAAGSTVATEKINVGIILTVTPQVSSDGFVLMNISVKSSSVAPRPAAGQVLPFDELSREAIANVLVRDGETIVLGGIMKDTAATSESGIPYLKDIPVLGWFFKNIRWQKDFEELVVFITPRVLGGGSENLPAAEQLWRENLKKTNGS